MWDDADTTNVDLKEFTITINAAPALAAVANQSWTVGTAVDFDLPAATGGTTPLTYALTGTLPAGLTFDGTADPPNISGTPTTAAAATTLTYTVTDANGASPATPPTFSVTVASDDTTAPTVLRVERHDGTSTLDELTNSDTLTFRVTFSEAVVNVSTDGSDFAASGTTATATGVTGSGDSYIVTVGGGDLATYNGAVGLGFAGTQDIDDAAGNDLTNTTPSGANQTYTLDNMAPTVVSIERHDGTSAQAELTNANSLNFRVTFSEGVENVGQADFDASGTTGDATRIQGNIGGTTRIVTISGGNLSSRNGTVGLTFATGVTISDLAGNALNATLPTGTSYETYTLDTTDPTVTLTAPDNHDGTAAFNVAAAFNEDVSGFDAVADVTITGGTLTSGTASITRTDAQNYTLNITPSGTGNVTVQVPANAAADGAGNGNTVSATSTVNYQAADTTAPTVMRIERHDGTSAQDELTTADSLQFRVTFSEAVQNVDTLDFDASGTTGDATAVTAVTGNAAQYIVTVSGGDLNDYDGTVGLTFATGPDIADTAGNALTATLPSGASYQTYTLDNTAPMVLVSAEPGTHDGSSTINITFTFSEPVRGFVVNDLNVTGATTSAFTGSDNDTRYSVTLTPSGNADATVQVPANRAQDAAGNGNAVSPTRTVLYLAPGAPGISVSRTVLFVPEGGSATYTIVLTAAPTANVTVNALFNNGEDESTCDCDPDLSLQGGRSIDARHPSRNEVLEVTFTPANWDTPQTVTVTAAHDDDADNGTDDIQHGSNSDDARYVIGGATVTAVEVDDEAGLGLIAPANQFFTSGRAISVAALPAAVGATGMVAYALVEEGTNTLPNWLSFNAATRVMSGTPPTVTTPTTSTLAYTATDDNGTAADTSDDVTTDPATFTITVNPAPALTAPADQAWAVGTAVDFDLPAATGGTTPFTYTLEGPSGAALPTWMTFDGTADPPNISGTPTAGAAATTYTYTATDANGASPAAVTFDAAVVAAAPTGPFSWSATLTVGQSSAWWGYCGDPCPITMPGGGTVPHGTLSDGSDAVFAVPGTGDVTVTALDRYGNASGTGNRLVLGLSPLPAPSEYGSWTVTWGETTVALSTRSRVATDGTLEFDNFFSGLPAVTAGQAVYVCIASAGQDCVLPDTSLSTLTLAEADGTSVAISPALAAGTTEYTASVVHDVATVTVAAAATATGAEVDITPADADTNTAGHQVALTAGDDTDITVTVTNTGVSEEYTLTVTRAGLPAGCEMDDIWCTEMDLSVAQVAFLGGFCGPVPNGCSGEIVGSVVDDDFVVAGTTYRVTTLVWFAGSHQTLANQVTFDLDRLPAAAVYQQWTLHIGDDVAFLADVTPTTDATFNFPGFYAASTGRTRPAADSTVLVRLTEGTVDTRLSDLGLTAGGTAVPLTPTFAPAVRGYRATVGNAVDTVTVSATASDTTNAMVAFTPADADTNTVGHQVSLTEGENTVTATVTNGAATRAYTITVTRAAPLAWSATLTVGQASVWYGYCGASCPVGGQSAHGTLADDGGDASFTTIPGGGTAVQVTALERSSQAGGDKLTLGLSPLPAAAVYGEWTLDWGGVKQVKLSANSRVNTTTGLIEFDTFFTGVAAVSLGQRITVCIREDSGTCPAAVADTRLSELELAETDGTDVPLTPTFDAATMSYTVEVENDVATVTVSAEAFDGTAAVAFTPATDADTNTDGHQVSLDVGDTDITATVTKGTATETYTITVTRKAPNLFWTATLTIGDSGSGTYGYWPNIATGGDLMDATFTPPGGGATTVNRLWWDATGLVFNLSDTLPAGYEAWTLYIGDIPAPFGDSSETGTRYTWSALRSSILPTTGTVTVCMRNDDKDCSGNDAVQSDTTLSALTVTAAAGGDDKLNPEFPAAADDYTAEFPNDVDAVTVAATKTAASATLTFSPATDADTNAAGHQVNLTEGENTITVTVTDGGLSRVYTIVVTRAAGPLSCGGDADGRGR